MLQKYLDYLYNLGEFNIKLGLSTIGEMLNRLGNPHHHPRIIHIAGTNGKGSTLTTLESLLIKSGFTTGATVSPHLVSYNERFRINGKQVDDKTLVHLFDVVCEKCGIPTDLSSRTSADGKISPTFFEFSLAIAFLLFHEAKVDYILLETGLGGRLDATNIVQNPLACAITRIAIDHQEFLGDSIIDIANEKLGILKPESPVFIASQDSVVMDHMVSVCQDQGANYYYNPENYSHHREEEGGDVILLEYRFNRKRVHRTIRYKNMGLSGDHQHENITTALAVYHAVVPEDEWLSESEIACTLEQVYWPARLEYFGDQKNILIDGAHNTSGVTSLMSYLRDNHPNDRILFAIGWMKGKNFIDVFKDYDCGNIVFMPIQGRSERSETGAGVVQRLKDNGYESLAYIQASQLASEIAGENLPEYDLLVISGSFYLIGEFLEEWPRYF